MAEHRMIDVSDGYRRCAQCYWWAPDALPTDCPPRAGEFRVLLNAERNLGCGVIQLVRRAGFDYREGYGWYQRVED